MPIEPAWTEYYRDEMDAAWLYRALARTESERAVPSGDLDAAVAVLLDHYEEGGRKALRLRNLRLPRALRKPRKNKKPRKSKPLLQLLRLKSYHWTTAISPNRRSLRPRAARTFIPESRTYFPRSTIRLSPSPI